MNRFFLTALLILCNINLQIMADTSKSVGTTATSFSVTPTGGAVYNISFEVPKGIGNMQPKIGLAYNSQGGNGIAGYGFNVTGLSVITRGCKSIYYDGWTQGISHNASDAYFLDGCRLISQSAAEGIDGAIYTPEGSPYTKVTFHGSGTNVWIEVLSQDGIKSEYGRTSLSKQNYTNKAGETRTNAWYLNRQEDALGNYITYSYGTSNLLVYPTAISYGKNTNTSSGCNNVITFEYAMLGDNSHTFAIEDRFGKIDRKLTAIISKTGTDIYRKYTLNYNDNMDNSTTKYSKLTSVVESNGKGEEKTPIVINWKNYSGFSQAMGSISLNMEDTNPMVERQDMNILSADLNGDGISDVIRISRVRVYTIKTSSHKEYSDHTYAYIYRSNYNNGNTSFSNPLILDLGPQFAMKDWKTYLGGSAVMDIDGDGISDLLIPKLTVIDKLNSKYVSYIVIFGKDIKNGKDNVIGFNCPLINTKDIPYYTIGDFNNDGRDEIITIENTAKGLYYSAHLFYWDNSTHIGNVDLSLSLPKAPKKIFTGDYNNDGMTDIIVFYDGGYKIFYNNSGTSLSYAFLNSKSKEGTTFGYNWRMEQGDFNGDGLSDFVFVPGKDAHCYWGLSNGDGTFNKVQACILDVFDKNTTKDDDKFSLLPYDVDHDGVTDLVVVKPNYEYHGGLKNYYEFLYTGVRWYTSDRTKLVLQKSVNTPVHDDGLQSYVTLGDFNGDGYTDLLNYGCNFAYSGTGNATNSIALRTYRTLNISPSSGKVTQFTNGMGQSVNIQYSPASNPNVYTHVYDTDTYPMTDCHMPLHLVSSVTASNGVAGNHSTSYKYKGLKLHSAGKGVLGMTETTTTNNITGITVTAAVKEWDKTRFVPVKTITTQTLGNKTSTSENDMTVTSVGYKNYFCYPNYAETTDFDGNTVTTSYSYDTANGCITSESVNYENNMYVNTNYGSYVKMGNRNLPTLITKTQKHEDDQNDYTTKTYFEYNDKGQPTSVTKHYGTPMAITEKFTYDVVGNPLSSSLSGSNVPKITSYNEYDGSKRFVTKKYQTPQGAVNKFTYDTWGNVLTESDVTEQSMPLTTSHTYDGWGNELTTTLPTGEVMSTKMEWYGNTQYKTISTHTGQPSIETLYDACGRVCRTSSQGPNSINVSTIFTYDSKGQVTAKNTSTGNLSVRETFTYDDRGRVTSEKSTAGQNISYTYSNRDVTTTQGTRTYKKTFDAWGNIKAATDPVGSVKYKYFSNGKPSEVSSLGAVITMEYDDAGNQILLDDPDAGTTTYTYAADGKLLSQTDAKGNVTTNSYDNIGRLSSTVMGTEIVTYQYGQSGTSNMRLVKTQMGGNSINYIYDSYGRVTKKTNTVDCGDVLEYNYTYNANNQIEKVTYPGGLTISYDYDANGFTTATKADGSIVSELQSYDGLVKKTKTCQYLTNTVTKDSRGYVSQIKVNSGGRMVNDMSFSYDGSTGNMLSRTGMMSYKETFDYDNMDRLLKVRKDDSQSIMRMISYSPNGNINLNTAIGYSYYNDETKLHALTEHTIGSGSEAIKSHQITNYNAFNKVSTIEDTDSSFTAAFSYGPDLERWRMDLSESGQLSRRVIYGDNYEKVTENGITRHFYYIDGGMLIIRQDGKEDKHYFCCTDNLGSILKVVDKYGNQVFAATYDVWGKQTVTTNSINFRRGYCGHEMLPEFNLINMNGRLYDPIVCRFLSPDNYVQMPDNSQNFNRYSYCLNNPLKYTDPSGEFLHLIAGAVIGGVFNWAAHGFKFNAKGLGYFATGAVAGAVSAGIASGMNVAMAGGNFWTGAAGLAHGVSSTGFIAGAATGASSGFAGGFILGAGNSWVDGHSFGSGLLNGLKAGGIGALESGIVGGVFGGLDAIDNGVNFWTGKASADITGAMAYEGLLPQGIDLGGKVNIKYVGKFEGQRVFESELLGTYSSGNYSGFTVPDLGIVVGDGVFTSCERYGRAMMQHELGHVFQYRRVGSDNYYKVISKESVLNFKQIWPYNKVDHDNFWTETWANHLSKLYFGKRWLGMETLVPGKENLYYPSKNIDYFFYFKKFILKYPF